VHYGVHFSVVLGFLELCLKELLICMLVGGLMVALRVLLYGSRCLLVSCGVSGENTMIEVPRTARGRWRSLSPYF
jgi:hypothetical protein